MSVIPHSPNDLVIPDFMAKFANMFSIPSADDLSMKGESMVIASVDRDGTIKIKRGKDVVASILRGQVMIGIPIMVATPNVMFEDAQSKQPCCKSNDGKIGAGDIIDGRGFQADRDCSKCSKFQWGSDPKGGKGKWCKQTIVVALSCAGVMRLKNQEGKEYAVVSGTNNGPDHRWWYNIYDLSPGTVWAADYKHPGPVILRLTASSFGEWEKALAQIRQINPKWPIEATVWMVGAKSSQTASGFTVGQWEFKIAPVGEPEAWLMEEAIRLKGHPMVQQLGSAGHEAEGVVRDEPPPGA
jgi:hypothetical protein